MLGDIPPGFRDCVAFCPSPRAERKGLGDMSHSGDGTFPPGRGAAPASLISPYLAQADDG